MGHEVVLCACLHYEYVKLPDNCTKSFDGLSARRDRRSLGVRVNTLLVEDLVDIGKLER